jgi:hypothetical protein
MHETKKEDVPVVVFLILTGFASNIIAPCTSTVNISTVDCLYPAIIFLCGVA